MPVDVNPVADGNVLWDHLDGTIRVFHNADQAAKAMTHTNQHLHKSHFATCPDADQHRKKGRKRVTATR